ncbi:hypothetical protein [Paenibacillus senegalimassiliensis]|uniref:hypothetical protein n=1 Tax=Paenibacillus senegalimassiliensis TaxID=1737426 RepID=UPI00073F8C1A|nr:hypothetical protein [Paenibacillus senegalimassiliensis]
MKTRWQFASREEGITLVELLAVLVLAGLLTLLVSSVLSSSFFALDRITRETQLRNEAVTLSSALQIKLKNTVSVGGTSSGNFTQFQAELATDPLTEATRPIHISLDGDRLSIDGVPFSKDTLSLSGTYFTKGASDLQLHLKVALAGEPNVEPIYLFVSIKLLS